MTAPVLDYHVPAAQHLLPRWLRALCALGTVPIVVVPFVPFAHGRSPLEVVLVFLGVSGDFWIGDGLALPLLAGPFLVGIAIVPWQLRLLLAPRATAAERVAAYIMACVSALMTCGFFGLLVQESWGSRIGPEFRIWAVGPAVLLAGGALLLWTRKISTQPHIPPTVALHTAYLANALMCLWYFADQPDVGWWLTLIVSAVLLAELLTILLLPIQHRRAHQT